MEKIFEILTLEDLTPDLRMLAEVCGLEHVKEMLLNFSGINFYVPRISRLDTLILKYMKLHPDKSHIELAKELSVSGQLIKKLTKKGKPVNSIPG
jgi:hypothetical protein